MLDIVTWLANLGLQIYAKLFADNAIDADVLPDLTDSDLQLLGIPLGHRKKLLKAIEALKSEPVTQTPRPPAFRSAQPSTEVHHAERRQLSVMFVDLVGSTELSLKLDPEELRDLTRAYQDITAKEVARYGGHIAKYMGDGILIYFGYPQAHEDDAVRAIYAGLGLVAEVKRLGKRMLQAHGGHLRARVGVATGVVIVGDLIGSEGSEAGAELAVDYILEGSVRRSGEAIRVTAQLIHAASGHHLWAEKYDSSVVNLFEIQDRITQAVAACTQTQNHACCLETS